MSEFTGKAHMQDAFALFAQREAHRIGVTNIGQPGAILRIAQIASRSKFVAGRMNSLMPGSRADPSPSCSQWKALREGPV